mgnify:CR=1 FL=1
MKLDKQLIKFSFNQLVNLNIHLGIKQDFWNPLANDLVIGNRQNHYFLNLNLTIINLRYSFNLMKYLLKKNYKILFHNDNLILNKLLLKHFKLFKQLKMFFGLGKWVNGFLNNFKSFKFKITSILNFFLKRLKRKIIKKFFKLNKNRIWNFFLFLRNLKCIPSSFFLMFPNNYAVFEALKLNISSMVLVDMNKTESFYLATQYLIPFNYFNYYGLLFLFNNIKYMTLINFIKKKKFFFFLIYFLKKNKIFKIIKFSFSKINLFFNQFLLFFNMKNKNKLKKYNLFRLLNYKYLI